MSSWEGENGRSWDKYLRGPTKEKSHTPAKLATNTFAAETSPKAGFSSNFERKWPKLGEIFVSTHKGENRKPIHLQNLQQNLPLLKHYKVLNLDLTRFVGWAGSNCYHEIQHKHTLHTPFLHLFISQVKTLLKTHAAVVGW